MNSGTKRTSMISFTPAKVSANHLSLSIDIKYSPLPYDLLGEWDFSGFVEFCA
ncbi:hypothetical protein Fmac_014112 [Flemingia macrophylla]|uniref:Uncharacterized protein n=1 Tax=Flemingia macrophylla TaxID=520843 RepID=A0ABD1MAV0_9FABA